jgi:hypothetical protein
MEGYPKLAHLMAGYGQIAIFRRFKVLNNLDLLYQHAELIHLEQELKELAERDTSHTDRQFHAKHWWSLSQCDEDEDREQWEKMLEIRERLEKYSELHLCRILSSKRVLTQGPSP